MKSSIERLKRIYEATDDIRKLCEENFVDDVLRHQGATLDVKLSKEAWYALVNLVLYSEKSINDVINEAICTYSDECLPF